MTKGDVGAVQCVGCVECWPEVQPGHHGEWRGAPSQLVTVSTPAHTVATGHTTAGDTVNTGQ